MRKPFAIGAPWGDAARWQWLGEGRHRQLTPVSLGGGNFHTR